MISDGKKKIKNPGYLKLVQKQGTIIDKTLILLFVILASTQIGPSVQHSEYLKSCSVRYDVVHFLNHTCEEVYEDQPLCKETLRVAYYPFPPYIFRNKSGVVQGLVPGKSLIIKWCI